jgi:methylated-DNA-protein-cysteine methyltransferase-like protein
MGSRQTGRSTAAPIARARKEPSRLPTTSERIESETGTHARIHAVVRRIPRGRVATYGQIAVLAGLGRQPRLVGYALNALPMGTRVPWYRVINARGAISARSGDPAGALNQRLRLEAEGVKFDARGRVPLDRYRWTPRATR